MGRWSGLVAEEFLTHIPVRERGAWLDVGCGTGELLGAVLRLRHPESVVGIDSSPDFVDAARRRWRGFTEVAVFAVGSAQQLPYPAASFDGVASGLTLNFVPEPQAALAEMARVARPGATVGAYLWDYDYADFFLARYWAAAEQVLGRRAAGDERHRWPVCSPQGLTRLISNQARLTNVDVFPLTTTTVFADTAELWDSFSLSVGPAGTVMGTLDHGQRQAVRAALEERLPVASDGSVHLAARAWAFAATAIEGGGARPRVNDRATADPNHPRREH